MRAAVCLFAVGLVGVFVAASLIHSLRETARDVEHGRSPWSGVAGAAVSLAALVALVTIGGDVADGRLVDDAQVVSGR